MFFFFIGARQPFDSPELERLHRAIDTIRSRYPSMTLPMLSTLLRIGLVPDDKGQHMSISDIVERFPDQKFPAVARQIDLLGEVAGLGLVEKQGDPENRRLKSVGISAKGKLLLEELDLILSPAPKPGRGTRVRKKVKA
jgi:hypothetical protein